MKKHTIPSLFASALLALALIVPAPAAALPAPNIPVIAGRAAAELDSQVSQLIGQYGSDFKNLRIVVTTPANLNNLEMANTLARQMSEEMSYWLVNAGYQVNEIRRGASILFDPERGEFLLTRQPDLLAESEANAGAVLTGTYTVTPRAVRFNFRLLELATGETLAMTNATVPLTGEVRALLADGGVNPAMFMSVRPSTGTRLSGGTLGDTIADAAPGSRPASREPMPPAAFTTSAY